MTIDKEQNLKLYTTFNIGGKAKLFAKVGNLKEALEAIAYAQDKKFNVFVLGGGSNILVSDHGFDGLVIKNEIKGFKVKEQFITVGGGENWDEVVKRVIDLNLSGIECLSGIPGSFGGAVAQNIGAYGQTLADVVDSVEAIEISTGHVKVYNKSECEFEYRNSLFKKNQGQYFITAAILKLSFIARPNISYRALKSYFQDKLQPTLTDGRRAVLNLRAAKGMLISEEFESYKSAGSFFKNPIISAEHFDKIKSLINCPNDWYWVETNGIKVAAACLVESAGFKKGQIIEAAQISPRQPLAIINPGNAGSKDVLTAANKIKTAVMNKFKIQLEEEVVYVGKFTPTPN
jgi:UDP-N-acetylmuramate dehydrogenase